MCGIAGLIAVPGDNKEMARRLLMALRHRGPDDEGVEQPSPGATLIHSRLAIIDLTAAAHQPMRDEPPEGGKPNWITYNGEVFNYQEIRRQLERTGWRAKTKSDTEVILHAYRVWGEDCVKRFRGMFAFCLVDQERGIACLSRDRLGIKPLYLFRPAQGGLIFASELRALLALGPNILPPRINAVAMEGFLAQGAVSGYETIVDNVSILEPGSNLTVELTSGKTLRHSLYWQLPAAVNGGENDSYAQTTRERSQAVERLSVMAREAVRLRLISDVPLGLFLSGGVDSASVLALAAEVDGDALRTISLGFDSADYDESAAAAATARNFGAQHTTLRLSGHDLLASLPSVLKSMDQPTIDGMNTFIVSRAARDAGLTVAVSGLGGDELFGGYPSFSDVPKAVSLRRRLRWLPLGDLLAGVRRNRAGAKLKEALRREPDFLTMYLLRRELFLPHERRALLAELPEECDELTGLELGLLADLRRRSKDLDPLNRVSFFELELYMRHMLLRDGDVFSMAAPIEFRVPLLDHMLVEAVFSLPGSWKRSDPRPKPLLLDLVGPKLPAAVWRKPKQGFAFPWSMWLAPEGPLSPTAREAANDSAIWRQLGLNPLAVVQIWKQFNAGDRRVGPSQILALITLRDFATRQRLRAA